MSCGPVSASLRCALKYNHYFCRHMNVRSDFPQIEQLKKRVEQSIDFPLSTHGDFLRLSAGIEFTLREHMSESTLERLWGYSTRHYESVSMRTLNVLARFVAFKGWDDFCASLMRSSSDSDLFITDAVFSSDLPVGARIRIGWQPDRLCMVRHLGGCRFVVEEVAHAKLQPGDTFSCIQFQKGCELHMDDICRQSSPERYRYVAGIKSGITILEVL